MIRSRPHRAALGLVLAFSALLECFRLGQNSWANDYYSAAVKSMLGSLHNFFFVSSDPGGLITVDKPPLGLWLQTLSAAIFGFHPLSLLIPEALCAVAAVAVMYFAVAPRFGVWAGVAAAAALADDVQSYRTLIRYVRPREPSSRWDVLVQSSNTAAALILVGGRAAALGGYGTIDPVLTPAALARLVARGETRFVALGGGYASRGGNAASAAAAQACRQVAPQHWRSPHNFGTSSHPPLRIPSGRLEPGALRLRREGA